MDKAYETQASMNDLHAELKAVRVALEEAIERQEALMQKIINPSRTLPLEEHYP